MRKGRARLQKKIQRSKANGEGGEMVMVMGGTVQLTRSIRFKNFFFHLSLFFILSQGTESVERATRNL